MFPLEFRELSIHWKLRKGSFGSYPVSTENQQIVWEFDLTPSEIIPGGRALLSRSKPGIWQMSSAFVISWFAFQNYFPIKFENS